MQFGVLAGYSVEDIKVTLQDGAYHDVDSSELAFKIAGSMVFKEAARRADPALLEPVMAVEVTTPEDYMGTVIGDLNARRGQIQAMNDLHGNKVVEALVPLSEMFGYVGDLRSKTSGQANLLDGVPLLYAETPKTVSDEIIQKARGNEPYALSTPQLMRCTRVRNTGPGNSPGRTRPEKHPIEPPRDRVATPKGASWPRPSSSGQAALQHRHIGHIDHGKTTLTAAITKVLHGKSPTLNQASAFDQIDKAPEERQRGITISMRTSSTRPRLAATPTSTARVTPTTSRPDHRRGPDGRRDPRGRRHRRPDAADPRARAAGPQVGVPAIVVALNKCDMVDDEELLEFVELEVLELLSE